MSSALEDGGMEVALCCQGEKLMSFIFICVQISLKIQVAGFCADFFESRIS
jgi:hypothetical protein